MECGSGEPPPRHAERKPAQQAVVEAREQCLHCSGWAMGEITL